ncbi:sensor histidine kinase [Altibacter sp. HG106]|uniref:sensor histidine kinase n=1 Tax=Altibacter sp. HG106 TaxID=3023937 RepID=UPI00234FF31C|nr:HAMP domain-containing sensor histidine kinase [Altibacter sp. HG106]MDC7994968.1 HAMP domain-containing sensor histidine kinase [Altibacter sp. HG106]
MKTYSVLDKVPFLKKSFSLKIFTITFIGIHVPLLAVIVYLFYTQMPDETATKLTLIALAFTLAATGTTLWLIHNLLIPIQRVRETLNNYIDKGIIDKLPDRYEDEVGMLMKDTQFSLIQLDSLFSERERIITLFSHDLRNPLHSINGITELMRLDETNTEKEEHLDLIENVVTQQIDFLNHTLVDLKTKQAMGVGFVQTETVSLKKEVLKILLEKSPKVESKNILVNTDAVANITVPLPTLVFRTVMGNLLNNAFKFTPEDGKVYISAAKEDSILYISVRDTGIGFLPNQAEEIFKFNSPMSRKGTKGEPSQGVGMHLCKSLLARQGGTLSATSEGPNKGATFHFTIPLHES